MTLNASEINEAIDVIEARLALSARIEFDEIMSLDIYNLSVLAGAHCEQPSIFEVIRNILQTIRCTELAVRTLRDVIDTIEQCSEAFEVTCSELLTEAHPPMERSDQADYSMVMAYPDLYILLNDLTALDQDQRLGLAADLSATLIPAMPGADSFNVNCLHAFVDCLFSWHSALPHLGDERRAKRYDLNFN